MGICPPEDGRFPHPDASWWGDDDPMEDVNQGQGRSWPALALAAAALVANVVGVALFSKQAPYVGFLDLARIALPGLAFAGAAAVVAMSSRGGLAPVVLASASMCAAAPWLGIGLEQQSAAWVAVLALGAGLAPAVVVTALVFPDGRIVGRLARGAAGTVVGLGALAVVARATTYDPAAWGWCRCVANPLAVGIEPTTYPTVDDALVGVNAVVLAIGLVTFLLVAPRPPRGTGLLWEVVVAVLTVSWLADDAWQLFASAATPGAVTALRDAALVALPVAYVVGYAAQRPSRAHVADLLLAARGEPQPGRLRDLVARAIGDPRTTVAWWDSATNGFRDHMGRPVTIPERNVLAVEAGGRPIALVLSDRLDLVDPGVRDSVAQALLLSSENRRLTAELQTSLEQVRDSRARILTASDETRRRIERDLHDGAQQLLIATGIKLNLAAARAGEGDTEDLAGVLADAQAELHRALSELRSLASGIAPTALVHGTLDSALRELALHSPVPTTVRVTGDRQPDEGTAATAYFVAAECLTNVAKHADANRAVLEVTLGDTVRVRVIDDGHGGARLDGSGTGLRGLIDRVEARSGRLEVISGPGGTTIDATVPGVAP